ncbi:MAG: FAD-binding oxidoreductase [Holophagales bacterium]|jgi:glycolate oxidase|nr:FAD-binding oxidoreductase [Holophagales bacterium]
MESSRDISRDAYRAIEDIVGADNITDDPAILDSYAFQWLAELVRPERSHYMPRPWAVVMPLTTEEVVAVTKVCNKYHVKVKPISTGWYHWAAPLKDDEPTVQFDLRRMNRILEIDEKNMYAVVESGVICAQLQAEVMKRGLNINIIGAGCSTSIVASASAYFGGGPSSYFLGSNSDNLLGQEWVTPAGEIVRTGSLSSGCGWFCGEGPGPSARAITRGTLGTRGGLGVFTKCAVKLGPWEGPPVLQPTGKPPAYRLPIPDNFRVYTVGTPSFEALAEIYYEIYDNAIGYIFHRQFNLAGADLAAALWLTYLDPNGTMNDVEARSKDPEVQKISEEARVSFQIILQGRSKEDIELQDRILDEIIRRTGCYKVERFCEADFAEFTNMYLQRMGHKHCNFVWVGGYMGSWMQAGTPDFVKGYVKTAIDGFERDQKSGLLVQCGGDAMMGCGSTLGGGGFFALEQFVSYDPNDNASVDACIKHMEDAITDCKANGIPLGKEYLYLQIGWTDERIWDDLSKMPQQFVLNFQRKIKEAFDPNGLGDRNYPWLPEGWGQQKTIAAGSAAVAGVGKP